MHRDQLDKLEAGRDNDAAAENEYEVSNTSL